MTSFFLFLSISFFVSNVAYAQCTSSAGVLTGPTTICTGAAFSVTSSAVFDSNDVIVYVAYIGNDAITGSVLATSADGNFEYQSAFADNASFSVSAIVGTGIGGVINYLDPCLSVSNSIAIQVSIVDPSIQSNGTEISCTQSTISLTAVPSGLTYVWDPNLGGIETATQPGTYTVTATNANGCTGTASITITSDLTAPTVSITPPNITLTCATTGPITLFASGASVYAWSTTEVNATITVNPTTTTTYTVTGTAANGCTASAQVTVTVDNIPPLATITAPWSGSTITCTSPGPIIFTAGGGGTYSWSNGSSSALSSSITTAGTYTVTVTAANGCTDTQIVVVTSNTTPPTASITGNLILNCTTTSTFLTGSGGGTYSWSNGSTNAASNWISSWGTYTVTVTASNGCTDTETAVVTLNNTPPTAAITGNLVLNCTTTSTILTASGGGTYAWTNNGSTTAISNPITTAGTYYVTVTAANGCTSTSSVTIIVDNTTPIAGITASSPQVNCTQPTVSLTGTGGGTYTWSSGGGNPINVGAGNYTVTVTGSNGCMASSSIVITTDGMAPPPSQTAITQTSEVTCLNPTTNLQTPGGLFYQWSNGVSGSNIIENVGAGTYTVTVTGLNGCTATSSYTIATTIPECVGFDNQVINCTNPTATLSPDCIVGQSYLWSNGATTPSITVSSQGNYSVSITDTEGCVAVLSAFVSSQILDTDLIADVLTCNSPSTTITAPFFDGATYNWSGGVTGNGNLVQTNTVGTYSVTITQTNGCVLQGTTSVIEDVFVNNPVLTQTSDCSLLQNTITLSSSIPNPDWSSINWSNGESGSTQILATTSGQYCVTVTALNGCTKTACTDVSLTPLTAIITEVEVPCAYSTLIAEVSGGVAPFTFDWGNGLSTSNYPLAPVGINYLTVTDALGCSYTTSAQSFDYTSDTCSYISGIVRHDVEADCIAFGNDLGLSGFTIMAQNGTSVYYGLTQADGSYKIYVPYGNYSVSVTGPTTIGDDWQFCAAAGNVVVSVSNNPAVNFLAYAPSCAQLSIDIANANLRPCMSNHFYVYYGNNGGNVSENTIVNVTLDPNLTVIYSSKPYTTLSSGVYSFSIGNLNVNQTGFFYITATLACDFSLLNSTLCANAEISSSTACVPFSAAWSGASLNISSYCEGDSVYFNFENEGTASMSIPVNYIVMIDDEIAPSFSGEHPALGANESFTLAFEANGATWYSFAPQEPFHPVNEIPTAVIEGCGGTGDVSTGFVNTYPTSDLAPDFDEDCTTVTASYDPNDKRGFPLGYGEEHNILPNTDIEYMIRFQNTGTDTAFTVVIRDTLPATLQRTGIEFGAASHNHTVNMEGDGILVFTFNNIMLPDSNINEPESHGFVTFRIRQMQDLPLLTKIENSAAIYFDFNEPIITNTSLHTVNEDFITVSHTKNTIHDLAFTVHPNPMENEAIFEVPSVTGALSLQMYGVGGNLVETIETTGPSITFKRNGLAAGVYFFRIIAVNGQTATGQLILR